MTGWSLFVWICTPIPFVLLMLLTLPIPQPIKRAVLTVSRRTLTLPLIGGMQAIHVMLFVSSISVANQAYYSQGLRQQEMPALAADRIHIKAKIWRAERNFWIACLCFVLWWMLYNYHRLLIKWLDQQAENRKLREQVTPGDPVKSTGEKED